MSSPLSQSRKEGEEEGWSGGSEDEGMFNVASLCGLTSLSSQSEGERVSGAISELHGAGLPVVPLAPHWELPEPSARGPEDVVDMSVLLFSFNLTLEKNVIITVERRVLPASREERAQLLAALPARLPSKTKTRHESIRDQFHAPVLCTLVDGHTHLIFLLRQLVYLFVLLHTWNCSSRVPSKTLY